MTIDGPLLGAVRHYLMGMVGAAALMHSELEANPEHDLSGQIEGAKTAFLRNGRAILDDPAHYAHQKDYSITEDDRAFLEGLLKEGKGADWNSKKQVMGIDAKIDEYAPHVGGLND
ncbi:hypothetical protein J4470_03990 [Candidatus Woesearchaeota archaeon]|nr:hypothetical protein [Candidatus Woesearchaeota archaeon]